MHGSGVEPSLNSDAIIYRHIFEQHDTVKLLIDPHTGVIVAANAAACAFYGYPHEQLTALKISDLNILPPDAVAQEMARAESRQSNHFVFPHRLASGDIRTVEVHACPVTVDNQRLLYSIITDVTEQQRVEEALLQRTEQLRLLHEAAQQLSQSLDLETIYDTFYRVIAGVMDCDSFVVSRYTPGDNLIHCVHLRYEGRIGEAALLPPVPLNPEGRGTQSIAIRTGQSLLLNDYRAYSRTSVNRYLVTNNSIEKLETSAEPDNPEIPGSALIVPMKLEAAVVGVIQVFSNRTQAYTDADLWLVEALSAHVAIASRNADLYRQAQAELTERCRAENEARASEAKFRAIFNKSPEVVLIISRDGTILGANHAVQTLLGYTEADLIGQPFWRLLPSGITQVTVDWLEKVTAIEHSLQAFDFLKADGGVCPMQWSAVLIPWGDDTALLATMHDVSGQRQLEAERLKAEMLYLQIQKERELVALREQFINTISHEFRTPLAVIQSSSDLLEHYRDRLPPEREMEHLHEIKRQVHRMADMIEDVLKISKARAGKLKFRPAPLHLNSFCQSLLDQVRRTASATHRLTFSADGEYPAAAVDERLLTHILINLLTNAVKYSPAGGEIHLKLMTAGDHLQFEVSDSGIGIPLEDRDKLFEPFYRAINVGEIEGSGLGLAVVKDSVILHGGTIDYSSQPGHGTTFIVRLPRT